MIGVQLAPVDTWFFRDATPFAAGDAPQDDVGSLFPPHPATVVGALRASLAMNHGWSGRGRWPQDICTVLGDGPDDLGQLAFDTPILLKDGQPLFRAPRHLLGTGNAEHWEPSAFLSPGPPVACDLGDAVRLPVVVNTHGDWLELQAGDDQWLTVAGVNAALRGELPPVGERECSRNLWSVEPRIGLALDRSTGTAQEGMLYSVNHVRPTFDIGLGARIDGLPADWSIPFGDLVSLGGEGRLAECREWDAGCAVEAPLESILADRRVAIIALSPLDIGADVCLGRQPLEDLGHARVVSASLDRPQRVGGWNSLARRPLPLRSVLPAGSVLFCEIEDPGGFEQAAASGTDVVRLGRRREWGFGLAAMGVWPRATEV